MKLFLIFMLALISTNSVAAWVKVGGNKSMTIYAHPSTIRKTAANKITMWSLYNYNTVQGSAGSRPYMSLKSHDEYDCRKEQSRMLYSITHSKNMGGGRSLYNRKSDKIWSLISPMSKIKLLWEFACRKQ